MILEKTTTEWHRMRKTEIWNVEHKERALRFTEKPTELAEKRRKWSEQYYRREEYQVIRRGARARDQFCRIESPEKVGEESLKTFLSNWYVAVFTVLNSFVPSYSILSMVHSVLTLVIHVLFMVSIIWSTICYIRLPNTWLVLTYVTTVGVSCSYEIYQDLSIFVLLICHCLSL